jgi:glutaredoxin 3
MMLAQPQPPDVIVYRTPYCPYCTLATRLLESFSVAFREIDVSRDPERRRWLLRVSGQRTVPQIFVGERSIGGYRELRQVLRGGPAALLGPASEEVEGRARPQPEQK